MSTGGIFSDFPQYLHNLISLKNLAVRDYFTVYNPNITYKIAIFAPNMLLSRTKEPRSTIGEEIKKEKVTPSSRPANLTRVPYGKELCIQI